MTYIDRNEKFIDRNPDFEKLKPNKGDWIGYSKDYKIQFKNSFFRLKPGSTAYMEIKFAWPLKANKLGKNETSVFAVDPDVGWVTEYNDQLKQNVTLNYTNPVFWNET